MSSPDKANQSSSSDQTRKKHGFEANTLATTPLDSPPLSSPPLEHIPIWTEDHLCTLDPHEHDFQEFKSSTWLVKNQRELQPDVIFSLSKQVSAFVNGAGGLLFIGIDDDGRIDGGVPIDLKGGGTREWLEDIVSTSVTPLLTDFNVFEVCSSRDVQGDQTQINSGSAVYILDLPASENAPHQSKDRRYYLRVAGKSRPMSHLHIEDVLRRNSLPRVQLSRLHPYGEIEYNLQDSRGPQAFLMLRACIHNSGRSMARHVGVELTISRDFTSREVRNRMSDLGETHYTQRPSEATFFRYHPTPLFPTQEVYGLCLWVCVHQNNLPLLRGGAEISWAVYADDAQPTRGKIPLTEFSIVRQAMEWIKGL